MRWKSVDADDFDDFDRMHHGDLTDNASTADGHDKTRVDRSLH